MYVYIYIYMCVCIYVYILIVFGNCSKISGLKPNKLKCEIAGIGALKGVRVGLSGIQCINLN